jgi:regulatory protein
VSAAGGIKARAVRWLAMREHSRSELRRKLLRHADAAGEADDAARAVDELLDALERDGLLSEERFVASRVRVRAAKLGTARIAVELARHGLELPAEAAAGLAASEVERARAVWQRRFGAPASDAAERARQARFLISRGFAADAVRRVIRGLDTDTGA